MQLFRSFMPILAVILSVFLLQICVQKSFVSAEDPVDAVEEEEEDVQVDMEDAPSSDGSDAAVVDQPEDEDELKTLKPSADADTYFLFTKPTGTSLELPAGKDVQFLVGFTNKGSKDFLVETMDASFRYPMDFSFYIQNFTTIGYNKMVKPKQQVTFYYTFYTSETFSSRPFGLTVNLKYKDIDGNDYLDAVFNDTVNIIELDEGLDGETFFLYVFLAACAVLLLVAGQQFLVSFGRRRPAAKAKVETGTSNPNDVDFDWLPQGHLNDYKNKSPKQSPRQSARSRRAAKRNTGSSDE